MKTFLYEKYLINETNNNYNYLTYSLKINNYKPINTHKLYFPKPLVASSSDFFFSLPWYLDFVHLSFWFFFLSTILSLLFLFFLFSLIWLRNENKYPIRETRGQSRSQLGDIFTSIIPLTWSITMLAHASTHSNNFDENTTGTLFSISVIAYQWGWNYYYPRDIIQNFNSNLFVVGHNLNINFTKSNYDMLYNNFFSDMLNKKFQQNSTSAISGKLSIDDFRYLYLFPYESKFDFRLENKFFISNKFSAKKILNKNLINKIKDSIYDITINTNNTNKIQLKLKNIDIQFLNIKFFNYNFKQNVINPSYDSNINKNIIFQNQNYFINIFPYFLKFKHNFYSKNLILWYFFTENYKNLNIISNEKVSKLCVFSNFWKTFHILKKNNFINQLYLNNFIFYNDHKKFYSFSDFKQKFINNETFFSFKNSSRKTNNFKFDNFKFDDFILNDQSAQQENLNKIKLIFKKINLNILKIENKNIKNNFVNNYLIINLLNKQIQNFYWYTKYCYLYKIFYKNENLSIIKNNIFIGNLLFFEKNVFDIVTILKKKSLSNELIYPQNLNFNNFKKLYYINFYINDKFYNKKYKFYTNSVISNNFIFKKYKLNLFKSFDNTIYNFKNMIDFLFYKKITINLVSMLNLNKNFKLINLNKILSSPINTYLTFSVLPILSHMNSNFSLFLQDNLIGLDENLLKKISAKIFDPINFNTKLQSIEKMTIFLNQNIFIWQTNWLNNFKLKNFPNFKTLSGDFFIHYENSLENNQIIKKQLLNFSEALLNKKSSIFINNNFYSYFIKTNRLLNNNLLYNSITDLEFFNLIKNFVIHTYSVNEEPDIIFQSNYLCSDISTTRRVNHNSKFKDFWNSNFTLIYRNNNLLNFYQKKFNSNTNFFKNTNFYQINDMLTKYSTSLQYCNKNITIKVSDKINTLFNFNLKKKNTITNLNFIKLYFFKNLVIINNDLNFFINVYNSLWQKKNKNQLFFLWNNLSFNNEIQENKLILFKNKIKYNYININETVESMRRLRVTKGIILPSDIFIHIICVSKDVIHSWAIPGLGIKIDAIPGFNSHRRFLSRWRGIFWGQCMEVCGRYHHWMPILIKIVHKDQFLLWCTIILKVLTEKNLLNEKQLYTEILIYCWINKTKQL